MTSEKNTKFMRSQAKVKYFFLVLGIISIVSAFIVPRIFAYRLKYDALLSKHNTIIEHIEKIQTSTDLEAQLKKMLLESDESFVTMVLILKVTAGIFIKLGFIFIGAYAISAYFTIRRYETLFKELNINIKE